MDVVITIEGINLIERSSKAIGKQENLFHNLSDSEASHLNELLDKMRG